MWRCDTDATEVRFNANSDVLRSQIMKEPAMNSMNLYLLPSRQLTLNRRLVSKYLLPARYDTCDIIYLVNVTKL